MSNIAWNDIRATRMTVAEWLEWRRVPVVGNRVTLYIVPDADGNARCRYAPGVPLVPGKNIDAPRFRDDPIPSDGFILGFTPSTACIERDDSCRRRYFEVTARLDDLVVVGATTLKARRIRVVREHITSAEHRWW